MRVLYVSHYGILEPLGQTQILPYLTGLAAKGHSIDILSFEKPFLLENRPGVQEQQRCLDSFGIRWFPRPYRRGDYLPHLIIDVLATSREIRKRCAQDGIDLLHCRAHVPSWMAWSAARRYRIPLLFDFRGFMAEEYTDSGLWRPGDFRFRLTKAFERRVARRCAAVVVLTAPVRDFLQNTYALDSRKLFVIPCCVDTERFQGEDIERAVQPNRPLRVVYAGSTRGRYRISEMIDFFQLLLKERPESHLSILSSGDPAAVRELATNAGLGPGTISVESLPSSQVPKALRHQDIGLIFLRGGLALLATSPTKLGEYLACGLCVIAEDGIGGLDQILVDEKVGCLINSADPMSWAKVLETALLICDHPERRKRARKAAMKYYSLEDATSLYESAYQYARSQTTRA